MPRVLCVSHNHPSNRPGGGEVYGHELYRALRDSSEFDAIFVCKGGPPFSEDRMPEGGRVWLGPEGEYFFYTHNKEFDHILDTARQKQLYIEDWRQFLLSVQPDVVHFQHALFLGYDMIRETRRTLPDVPIVYTLHEFKAICQHHGQMVRTENYVLCYEASPRRCNQCFPDISAQTFFLRERFIKSAFELVDMFIVPSEHGRQRYIEWGIPAEKIRHEPYGRIAVQRLPDPPGVGRRNRIGYIGQMTPVKGVDLLLEAMKILGAQGSPVELSVHGGNLRHQSESFRKKIRQLLSETEATVTFPGTYTQDELPGILSAVDWVVVPSIWWETGPLVIHEALAHGRPVICSDIGAMVERIANGVNGLHFRVGDPYSLADVIDRAISTSGLWSQLRAGIVEPPPMDAHVARIGEIYRELLEPRPAAAREEALTTGGGR